ncbi:uncharacterized protein LOC142343317 isoform X1 [Convolutriloba macropyga]|uniref:uncharacterized protein LOC142343317 isoform X1 n=1 Tax=Convolutriloba macropyga TaxID=536237 RepID=UPI003F51B021
MAPKVAASDEKKKKMTLLQRKIRLSKQKYSVRPEKKHKKKGAYPKVTLRKSLTPGTIVILVAGKQVHRGRRLVFVKMLDSGHLLLAGPKGLNRMPLMPVLQNFVIATSTSIPLTDAVKTQADKIDFSMFKKLQEKKSKESGIFTDSAAKDKVHGQAAGSHDQASTEPRIDPEVEKALDDALMASVENFSKDPLEKEIFTAYMRQKFTLKNGLMPHNMKF